MLNTITLQGRFTETPVLKTTNNGAAVTAFTLAVPRDYKTKDGKEITDFIDFVAWEKKAEFITRNFARGEMTTISGSLETRKYEDKDGNKRTAYEVKVEKVYFAGGKKSDNGQATPQAAPAQDFEEIDDDSDLPF
jgi:single-strand DNA-binding protein